MSSYSLARALYEERGAAGSSWSARVALAAVGADRVAAHLTHWATRPKPSASVARVDEVAAPVASAPRVEAPVHKHSKTALSLGAAAVDTVVLAGPLAYLHAQRRKYVVGDLPTSVTPERFKQLTKMSWRGAVLDTASRASMRTAYFGVSTALDPYDRDIGAAASVVIGAPLASLVGVPTTQCGTHGKNVRLSARPPHGAFSGVWKTMRAEGLYVAAAEAVNRAVRHGLEMGADIPADTREGAQFGASTLAGALGGASAAAVSHSANCQAAWLQLVKRGALPERFGLPSSWPPVFQKNAIRAFGPRAAIGMLTGVVAANVREAVAAHLTTPPPPTPATTVAGPATPLRQVRGPVAVAAA